MSDTPSSTRNSRRALKGAFITFEGIDGCGKTTQARLLADKLKAHDFSVVETREPGGTQIGREIRDIVLATRNTFISRSLSSDRLNIRAIQPTSQLLLFLADRIQHINEIIRPAIESGKVVICDRYHDATIAYQKYGGELNLDILEPLITEEITPTKPDLTFWLDIDEGKARERTHIGDSPAIQLSFLLELGANFDLENDIAIDKLSAKLINSTKSRPQQIQLRYLRRIRKGYAALHKADKNRIEKIDGSKTIEEVQSIIWEKLTRRFHVL